MWWCAFKIKCKFKKFAGFTISSKVCFVLLFALDYLIPCQLTPFLFLDYYCLFCVWILRRGRFYDEFHSSEKDAGGPGGGRGFYSRMKQMGMLAVSLRGVNFGFWSRLGCSGQSTNILSRQGLVYGSTKNLRFMTLLLKTTFR